MSRTTTTTTTTKPKPRPKARPAERRSALREAIAAELRAEAAAQRWSQTRMADALGISQPAMSRRLLGQSDMTIDDLADTCRLLGITPGQLIARAEARANWRHQGWNTADVDAPPPGARPGGFARSTGVLPWAA